MIIRDIYTKIICRKFNIGNDSLRAIAFQLKSASYIAETLWARFKKKCAKTLIRNARERSASHIFREMNFLRMIHASSTRASARFRYVRGDCISLLRSCVILIEAALARMLGNMRFYLQQLERHDTFAERKATCVA